MQSAASSIEKIVCPASNVRACSSSSCWNMLSTSTTPHSATYAKRLLGTSYHISGHNAAMDHITVPDLTVYPPRQGRYLLGGRYAWLARLADKVRAQHAGTNGDYVAYCPLSKAFLATLGITEKEFDELIDQGAGDEQ